MFTCIGLKCITKFSKLSIAYWIVYTVCRYNFYVTHTLMSPLQQGCFHQQRSGLHLYSTFLVLPTTQRAFSVSGTVVVGKSCTIEERKVKSGFRSGVAESLCTTFPPQCTKQEKTPFTVLGGSGSGGRAGHPIIRRLVVWSLAPAVHISDTEPINLILCHLGGAGVISSWHWVRLGFSQLGRHVETNSNHSHNLKW